MELSNLAARRIRRAATGILAAAFLSVSVVAPSPAQPASAPDPHPEQWWLDGLGAEKIWQRHTKGEGVVVAVVDSGVHPGGDLEGAVLPGFALDGSPRGNIGEDKEYHGTTMATEIAGRGTGQGIMGVAPGAKILPVKVPAPESNHTAEALRRLAALEDPPEIVNLSYGGYGQCSQEEQAAVRAAIDKGMILVSGAGNDHTTSPDSVNTPASCPGVITVGAFGWFGNTADGPDLRIWADSEHHPYLALAGPGMRIIAFPPGSNQPVYFDGTSDASAIVSGSFALVRGAFPGMPSRELVARVLATARHFDGSAHGTRNEVWGFGVIRPRHAIEDNVPADAPNPIYDALDEAVPPTTTPDGGETSAPSDGDDAGRSEDSEAASGESSDDSGGGLVLVLSIVGFLGLLLVIAIVVVVALAKSRKRQPPYPGPPGA